ncbi:MAG TPA: DUF3189 family protein [Symbiobacteriaceae bacterium]|nr:DUF3189 family protein [Symbiobacteriaceae bacterium]
MLVIYHSRGAYQARLAAALHVGLLPAVAPPDPEGLEAALHRLGGPEALNAEGLWAAGTDGAGRRVFALGRASRPDVTCRAFRSLAGLAAIDTAGFRLHNVGPAVAWDDLRVAVLRLAGLHGAARNAVLSELRKAWSEALRVVQTGAQEACPPHRAAPAPEDCTRRVIYYCYGSAHSSVTAANIHIGHLPVERRPSPFEILHQPLFDRAESNQIGHFRLMGTDRWGCEVYVLGLAGGKGPMQRAMTDFLAASGAHVGGFRFEPTLSHAGVLLRIGGYTSRGLGWVALGRPLCAVGVWLKYRLFAEHVRQVLDALALTQNPVSDIIG